jgi:hypothetical protein
MLAVTDDGSAAVSADRHGGVRLWPSLDGGHEPVVVPAEEVVEQLAIARDGDEIVIAVAGSLGQMVVIRTTAAGAPISRSAIDLERPIVALRASTTGFVALRDDTTIAVVDAHGAWRGTLVVSPGERITALASRRGRVLALVTAGDKVRARWIEGDPPGWGSESAVLPIDPGHAVLAPGHERIAGRARNRKDIAIVRLSDGRILQRSSVPGVGEDMAPRGRAVRTEEPEEPPEPAMRVLGFVSDGTLAVLVGNEAFGQLAWLRGGRWRVDAWRETVIGLRHQASVAVDRRVVSGAVAALALDTPDRRRYLGFRAVNVTSAMRRDDGWLIADRSAIVGIDDRLRMRKRYRVLGDDRGPPDNVILLDAGHYIEATDAQVYLVELARPERRTALGLPHGAVRYEPATRLLSIPGGMDGDWIGLYDPATGRFRETRSYAAPESLILLDPSLNGGVVAWKVLYHESRATITEVTAIDFEWAVPFHDGRRIERRVPRQLLANDLTFEWLTADLARHRDGPDGARVIVGGGRITLRDRDGERWAVALPGVVDVAWGGRDELIAFGSGLARIDVATGALLERRCGWDFGLWADIERPSTGARICEAP